MLDNNFYAELNLIRMGDIGWIFTETDLTLESEDHEKALNLALNKISGEWDFEKLTELLDELDLNGFDISISGFDGLDDLDFDLDGDYNPDEDEYEIEEDEYKEPDDLEVTVQQGDIYILGNHRLMCGDSTKEEDIALLMNGEQGDMVFTDPPYNVQFTGRSGKFDVIENDNLTPTEFEKFIDATVTIIKKIKPPVYYIWCNWEFYGILQNKLPYKNCIVWAKNVFGLGKGYLHQHEFCLFNGKIDEEITNETDLWEIKKDGTYMHPTQKPVELCGRALKNHSTVKNVLDLFGGSGSTLIACEQLNRNCYMMELDPHYCQVIINRWEEFTGEKAEKIEG